MKVYLEGGPLDGREVAAPSLYGPWLELRLSVPGTWPSGDYRLTGRSRGGLSVYVWRA